MTLKLHSHHQHRRRLAPCRRHPGEPLASLCAVCLRERLSLLNAVAEAGVGATDSYAASGYASLPELRRCRTFSGNRCESVGITYEPRRRSCEVRARSTLEDLFAVEKESERGHRGADGGSVPKCEAESKKSGALRGTYLVPELREEDEESDCEIMVSAPDDEEDFENSKTMKEFIDLELKSSNKPVRRDFKEIAGSFRVAASVFSRKLQKWKRKHQKIERTDYNYDKGDSGQHRLGSRSCETDSRVSIDGGRYSVNGIGRRLCDADPRCSLDLGRASVDCGRVFVEEERLGSIDAPRASSDGCMSGKPIPRANPPMVSVIENAMATIYGFDNRSFIAEKLNMEKKDRKSLASYKHLDSLSLLVEKKGFDRSNSKMNRMLIHGEAGDVQRASCSDSPPGEIEIFHGTKLLITEKELMGSRMSPLKDDRSDSLDTASKDMTSSSSSSSSSNGFQKPRKWGKFLNIWPLITRAKHLKSGEEKFDPSKKIDREASSDPKWKLVRSSSVASTRSVCTMAASAHGIRAETEARFLSLKRPKNGYSASSIDDGMLRFYLTPLRSYRRSKLGKSRLHKSHSLLEPS